MNAYELAEIMEIHDGSQIWEHGLEIANLLRSQSELIASLQESNRQQADRITKLEQTLQNIANESVELSHDKIKWQCQDHIRWAKEALK